MDGLTQQVFSASGVHWQAEIAGAEWYDYFISDRMH